jgi:hypothetical protein
MAVHIVGGCCGTGKVVKMENFETITVGTKTKRFNSYIEAGYEICEDKAFSLVFKNRSYDFTVRCNALRDLIVRQFKFVW